MNVKIIIFGSIFACFLMLLAPSVSAIEFGSMTENVTDYNETELIDAIKERIEELKILNPDPKFTLNNDDADGLFKGGLDDRYDWMDLIRGIYFGFVLASMLKNHTLRQTIAAGNIYDIVTCIINYEIITWNTLIAFGDAFDIIDSDEDGY